ncbi:hypothetical protein COJ85_27570 [Bacillus sp. AFS076308]|nr:hypothetical protein COJ85_27570 [Bacillus sp. AFS076308]PGV48621.1 hypothetical protein COD92_25695 [Bacillus sp. AFS037270]
MTLSQQQKTFCAKIALDPLPMRVFRSTCKRGKIIPFWGMDSLRNPKRKNGKEKTNNEREF